ncbi:hypothetical protein H0X48_03970 [Candidatus Dependentiae bacterium]|nr:hypothetical protein [Candidatus Dependentiae bacterium]
MKNAKLVLLALVTFALGSVYAGCYKWNITNTTDGEVNVIILRKGTLRADDDKKGVTIQPRETKSVDLGLCYCAVGVIANGNSGPVAGFSQQKNFSMVCASRNVRINHIGKQYTSPTSGGVTVVTAGGTANTSQPQLIPGSGALEIVVQ